MSDDPLQTTQLRNWWLQMQGGDRQAREQLIRAVAVRLERLTRKMLRRFPNVMRQADTDDVFQNSVVRLLRTLEQMPPVPSTRDFFSLAAAHVRRELLDLARHIAVRFRHGPPADLTALDPEDSSPRLVAELEEWANFHQAVEQLPAEQREVVGLIFYHGWPQKDVAELFGISERTVRRRWEEALVTLHQHLRADDA
jgi:RNA polymerase sigma-70 factor (ECF subfamily)